jgi:hypothetical protein
LDGDGGQVRHAPPAANQVEKAFIARDIDAKWPGQPALSIVTINQLGNSNWPNK